MLQRSINTVFQEIIVLLGRALTVCCGTQNIPSCYQEEQKTKQKVDFLLSNVRPDAILKTGGTLCHRDRRRLCFFSCERSRLNLLAVVVFVYPMTKNQAHFEGLRANLHNCLIPRYPFVLGPDCNLLLVKGSKPLARAEYPTYPCVYFHLLVPAPTDYSCLFLCYTISCINRAIKIYIKCMECN